ncbi:MAG: aromatic ring-hydroxylating dioxygenase subunit alpha [Gammaproteobacteria bacterium]|nr:MAG: aromatic ring-hydroxylating dioxygenase subunit alpha [Gammaproteobacteria bacterium]
MNMPLDRGPDGFIRDDRQNNEFLVPRQAFTSDEVLAAERERIFSTCWIYAAHASEIPENNDYVSRKVGGRELIIARDSDGNINAMFNTCSHRGAMVGREPKGNNKALVCPYHGWTFNMAGKMVGQPADSGFPDDFFADGKKDLTHPAHVDVYRDFIFVNFDRAAGTLVDYLADAADYLDIVADQSAIGMEVTEGWQEYSMDANWKLLVENSADGYHAITTHASYFDYLQATNGAFRTDFNPTDVGGRCYSLGNGHAVIEYGAPWGRPVAQWVPQWGDEGKVAVEKLKADLVERHGEERAARIAEKNRNILIFPNLVINDIMALTIRTFQPISTDYMEIRAVSLAPKEEHPDVRRYRQYNFLEFLGPAGFATPDDVEMLQLCQMGYQNMPEVVWNDISKGMNRAENMGDDELQMRSFWRRWNELMSA